MSDDKLSQEEIDALLNSQIDDDDNASGQTADTMPALEQYLSDIEQDTLGEIGNISLGTASTTLSTLLNQKVDITTPELALILRSQLGREFPHPHVAINVKYTEGFQGENVMVIRENDAKIIADLMLGRDGSPAPGELNDIELSAVQEAMNQMMGSASTSMSSMFDKKIDISPPSIEILDVEKGEGTEHIPTEEYLVKVSFTLKVGELIDSKMMQIMPVSFAKTMVADLLGPKDEKRPAPEKKQVERTNEDDHPAEEEDTAPPPLDYDATEQRESSVVDQRTSNIQPAAFSDFDQVEQPAVETKNLDLLLDIPLQVTVELGRTKQPIRDILNLSIGSIIELDKLAGEPVDILVNNKLIARGEVVVIDENFGVRVTDIISPQERIRNLR